MLYLITPHYKYSTFTLKFAKLAFPQKISKYTRYINDMNVA